MQACKLKVCITSCNDVTSKSSTKIEFIKCDFLSINVKFKILIQALTRVHSLISAQLPFKILSPVTPSATSGSGKTGSSVKKRPFAKDESSSTKAAQPKKPKTSERECVEVSSSSDEPRAVSPRRRPRALLDKFVRVESPVPEVSTSCDLVDLTGENKENRVEPPVKDEEMADDPKVQKGEDAASKGKDEDASAHVKAKEEEANASEQPTGNCDDSSKETKSVNESEQVTRPVAGIPETKTDAKNEASTVKTAVTSETKSTESGENSDLPKTERDQCSEVPAPVLTVASDAEEPISETEDDTAGEEDAPSAITASGTSTESEVKSAATKVPEVTVDSASAPEVSDSEKDDDADDESADDIEVLDDAKLTPASEGAANGADTPSARAGTTPTTRRPNASKKKTPKQLERERIRAKREQEKLVSYHFPRFSFYAVRLA